MWVPGQRNEVERTAATFAAMPAADERDAERRIGPSPLARLSEQTRRAAVATIARYGRTQLLVMNIAYVAGIAVYKARGITFSIGATQTVSQFMDTEMLQHDYVRTIWCLHAQPPLFNAWMGAVQKWSPLGTELSFCLFQLCLQSVLS